MAKYQIGDRVKVKRLHKLDIANPNMLVYLEQPGTVCDILPPEWIDVLGPFWWFRVKFDNETLEPLGFLARELTKL